MRLFIGLWPDEASALELQQWAAKAQTLCGGRQMTSADMHLTLAFLGQAHAHQVDTLVQAVTDWPIEVHPFTLTRLGQFERARVVWAGFEEESEPAWLHTAYATLWERLALLGWQANERRFTPHISLLRRARGVGLSSLQFSSVRCRPAHCSLVASCPGPDHSHYRMLAQLPIF